MGHRPNPYYVLEEKTDGVVTTPSKICLYKLVTAE